MCLTSILSKNSKEYKDLPKEGVYYKAVRATNNATWYNSDIKLTKGVHVDSNDSMINIGPDYSYHTGFHVFRSRGDAQKWMICDEKIIRMRINKKDIVACGYQNGCYFCVVAKKIRVIE